MKENCIKEYGGFLPLELANGKEWHEGGIALNSARSALMAAIEHSGYRKMWIPVYMCKSIRDTLDINKIEIKFYNIDYKMEPIDFVEQGEKDGMLICNFFGLLSEKRIHYLVSKYHNVILDNTQCFLTDRFLDVIICILVENFLV